MHRMNFSYKKPKHVPSKADKIKQEAFVEEYIKLKAEKAPEDQIYFMDGVHPMHNSQPAYGWIKKDRNCTLPSNTGRQRVNINGAINIESFHLVYREDEAINSVSAIKVFEQILCAQEVGLAYVIVDNARYYRSKLVREFESLHPRLNIIYLPPYSPNLNLIERLWKFMKKNVTYNKYYEKFALFRKVLLSFLDDLDEQSEELRTLLSEKFQIIETVKLT